MAGPTTPGVADDAFFHPNFILRISSEPARRVEELSDGSTARLFRCLLDAEADVQRRAPAICDRLSERYLAIEAQKDKQVLLQLKRDVFNQRKSSRAALGSIREALGPSLAGDVEQILDDIDGISTMTSSLTQTYEDEIRFGHASLARCFDSPDLALSIRQDSPRLFQRLERLYAGRDSGLSPKDTKGLHSTFVTYLLRAAMKTSPKSSLTMVGVGQWSPSASADVREAFCFADRRLERRAQLRHGSFRLLFKPLETDASLWSPETPFVLNPTLEQTDTAYTWLRIAPPTSPNPLTIDLTDATVSLKRNRGLDCVLGLLRSGPRAGSTLAQLRAQLEDNLPAHVRPSIDRLLASAIRQGIMLHASSGGAQAAPVDRARRTCTCLGRPLAEGVERALAQMDQALTAYGEADTSQRGTCLEGVGRAFDLVAETVHSDLRAGTLWPVLYEDCYLRSSELKVHPDAVAAIRSDLALLAKATALFPGYGRLRFWIAERFLQKFGPDGTCDTPTAFLRGLLSEIAPTAPAAGDQAPAFVAPVNPESPLAKALERASAQLTSYVTDKARAGADFAIDPDVLARLLEALPEPVRCARRSHCVNGQFYRSTSATVGFVVNQVYPGNSRMISRFLGHDAASVRPVVDYLQRLSSGRRFAAIPGVFGFNANLHARFADIELEIPPYERDFPSAEAWNIDEMFLRYRKADHRVVLCTKDGEQVDAYYFGILHNLILPPVHRLLDAMSGTAEGVFPLVRAHAVRSADNAGKIVYVPRIHLGSLVLARRTHLVPHTLLPDPDRGDGEFYYRLLRWRLEHGLPRDVFFNAVAARGATNTSDPEASRPPKWRKPMYLDFTSPLTVRPLQRMLRSYEGDVLFAEALPGRDDTFARMFGEGHVSEVSIELASTERLDPCGVLRA